MKVLLQWAGQPRDWREIDLADWASLPPGDLTVINVQGVEFAGPEIAVEPAPGGAIVTSWNAATKRARVWRFRTLAPDLAFGGAYNTRQEQAVYADDLEGAFPWGHFIPPVARRCAPQKDEDRRARRICGWREWTEGVPAAEIVDGRVRSQRSAGKWSKAKGTKTVFHHGDDAGPNPHGAEFTNTLLGATAGAASQQVNVGAFTSLFGWTAVSQPGFPGQAQWPAGTYRAQLDCTAVGVSILYGLVEVGEDGHFGRLNETADTNLQIIEQNQSAFVGTGLKLATTSEPWAAGNATDRVEITIVVENTEGVGLESITLELNEADDFVDGPWITGLVEREIEDAAVVVDSLAVTLPLEVLSTDAALVTDTIETAVEFGRVISDTTPVTDELLINTHIVRANDAVLATDELLINTHVVRVNDTVAAADQLLTRRNPDVAGKLQLDADSSMRRAIEVP